jgi:ribonuclease PH
MNIVATGELELVEVQGTAEGQAFRRQELDRMIDAALKGIAELKAHQARALQGG